MNFRNLLISASLIATAPVFAATYYVTPEGAGEKTGVDEANALSVDGFVTKAASCENGDTFNFAPGTYLLPKTASFENKGVNLIGSTEGRTIFSGDLNGDGHASGKTDEEGSVADLACLVFIKAAAGPTTVPAKPASVENIEFTCAYQTSQGSGDLAQGALSICNTWVAAVKNCKFYGNWADGSYGGSAAYANRSNVTFTNCVFSSNNAAHRGGAVRLLNDNKDKGTYTFDNCVFNNNRSYGTRGGALCIMAAKAVNISGCTFVNNKSKSMGSAIFLDVDYLKSVSANAVSIKNTTIAGNTTVSSNADEELADNGQIYVECRKGDKLTNSLTLENSIVVSSQELTKDIYVGVNATDITVADCPFTFTSNGYNVVGSAYKVGASAEDASPAVDITVEAPASGFDWKETDHVGADYTYSYVFGENKINSDNQLIPAVYIEGQDNKLPGAVNLTQSELLATGVEEVLTEGEVGGLTVVGANVYQLAGAACIEVYSISGAQMAVVAGDTIDLNGLNGGIYILRAGNKSYKVIK